MKQFTLSLLLLLFYFSFTGTSQEVDSTSFHSVFLIGDAGKDTSANQNLRTLGFEISRFPESTIIFLGDNIYEDGLSGKDGSKKRGIQEKKILAQIDVVTQHTGKVYFIPGNHDWAAGKWPGLKTMQRQAGFVEAEFKKGSTIKNAKVYIPSSGLPGPEVEMLTPKIRMIAVDTQWWLQSQFFHKVNKLPGHSRKTTEEDFFQRLDSIMKVAVQNDEQIILAAHHPLFSNGHHGSPKQPLRFLINYTPFQLFGLLGLNRMLVQDIQQPRYRRMKKKFLHLLEKYEDVAFVSGHEHNLQYHRYADDHFLISGSGSKISELVGDRYPAQFMDDRFHGFMRLDIYDDGRKVCHVYNGDQGSIEAVLELK